MQVLTSTSVAERSQRVPGRRQFRPRRTLTWFLAALPALLALYNYLIWPWISRWGATTTEVNQALPGDDLVPNPLVVTTKAVSVRAEPEQIWPWLVQLGVDRGGMYSYLWVENGLLRLNVTNHDTIHPEWQRLAVGDFIRFTPKEFALNPGPGLYVRELDPGRALIGCFGMENEAVDCARSATWQFIIEKQAPLSTRLILRSRTAGNATVGSVFAAKLGGAFQFYMERKMLLTLKARAETLAAHQ